MIATFLPSVTVVSDAPNFVKEAKRLSRLVLLFLMIRILKGDSGAKLTCFSNSGQGDFESVASTRLHLNRCQRQSVELDSRLEMRPEKGL
jgi:hypothetical protein